MRINGLEREGDDARPGPRKIERRESLWRGIITMNEWMDRKLAIILAIRGQVHCTHHIKLVLLTALGT